MKKLILSSPILLLLFALSCTNQEPADNRFFVKNVEKIISVENDKTMPKESLVQSYELHYSVGDSSYTTTMEVTFTSKKEVKNVEFPKVDKAWEKPPVFLQMCGSPCEWLCVELAHPSWPEDPTRMCGCYGC